MQSVHLMPAIVEILQTIIETAKEENTPVIIQASQGAIKYAELEVIVSRVRTMTKKAAKGLFGVGSGSRV